jgi:hypothetical protein
MAVAAGLTRTRWKSHPASSARTDLSWCIRAAAVCLVWTTSGGAWAANSPRETVRARIANCTVSIEYGRPSLRGREILTWIEPGQLWRLGADAPTTIESSRDLDFGGVRVPRGKHILIVRHIQAGVWSVVFSAEPAIDYTPGGQIAEVLMHFEGGQPPVQDLDIHLSSRKGTGTLEIAWGAYRLSTQFSPAR